MLLLCFTLLFFKLFGIFCIIHNGEILIKYGFKQGIIICTKNITSKILFAYAIFELLNITSDILT